MFAEFRYENIRTKANKNEHPISSKNSLMIVNKKEKIGFLGEVKKSKNWSNSRHGGPKRVIREDLR